MTITTVSCITIPVGSMTVAVHPPSARGPLGTGDAPANVLGARQDRVLHPVRVGLPESGRIDAAARILVISNQPHR